MGRLCADRRQVYNPTWTRCVERRSQRGGRGSRLAKVRRRIEIRWNEHEDPSTPLNADVSAAALLMSASTRSQPRFAQVSALPMSRTTPRTGWPAARRLRATSPPTLPVIPVTANTILTVQGSPVCETTIRDYARRTCWIKWRKTSGVGASAQFRMLCRQPLPYGIMEGLPVTQPGSAMRVGIAVQKHLLWWAGLWIWPR